MTDIDVKEIVKLAGGPTVVGRHLNIRPTAVSNWQHVPAQHMHRVATLTGLTVQQIRPDLMPEGIDK